MPGLPGTGTGAQNTLPNAPLVGTEPGGAAVTGQSFSGPGVLGQCLAFTGDSPKGDGVFGQGWNGVHGQTGEGSGHANTTPAGVWGDSDSTDGVYGSSASSNGVEGDSWSAAHAGVAGKNNAGGPGVWGSSTGNAGQFEGNVLVTGTLTITGDIASVNTIHVNTDVIFTGGDCAEQFDTAGGRQLEPGTVVVIDQEGTLCESLHAYDRRVAGVVSGAGEFRPAIVLDKKPSDTDRTSVALIGKVCCKVDAGYAGIDVGDLLTTSPTPGHAMKAADPLKAFGAVIGKALRPLPAGQGLIPILVALQ